MSCQYYDPQQNGATSFTVAMPRMTFGRGCLDELGKRTAYLNLAKVAIFTDPGLLNSAPILRACSSLDAANIEYQIFSDLCIEPTDTCAESGAEFLKGGNFDGVISVGGGSVIDTAKAALLLHAQGGKLQQYLAQPMGDGDPVHSQFIPHIACPTTSGTGSECTSMTVIRFKQFNTKFVICSPVMLPDVALIDPACTDSLPANAVASSGFDLLCHALECFTAKAYTRHQLVEEPSQRLLIQGANPWSEMVASRAIQIADQYLVRGVKDNTDQEARDQLMWGASLAGIAFGNTGTHLPHALSYGITHLMKDITTPDYQVASPFIPHGISVAVTAPSVFRYTAEATPERHMRAAALLGADSAGATDEDAGELLASRMINLMRDTNIPNGLNGVGFEQSHVAELTTSAARQKRAIANAPRDSNTVDLENIYAGALSYW